MMDADWSRHAGEVPTFDCSFVFLENELQNSPFSFSTPNLKNHWL
jgi:hypothetical protein